MNGQLDDLADLFFPGKNLRNSLDRRLGGLQFKMFILTPVKVALSSADLQNDIYSEDRHFRLYLLRSGFVHKIFQRELASLFPLTT